MKIQRHLTTFLAAILLLAALAACQPGAPEDNLPEYVLRASEYTFEAPAELPAGRAWIQLVNDGAEAHHLQFVRLNDGVTLEQFQTELQQKGDGALVLTTFPGGVGVLSPHGGQGRVLLDLTEGQYVLMCFIPDAEGVPHLAKGMMVPIRVVASDAAAQAEPRADVTATLKDFTLQFPAEVKAGLQMWKVTNEGPQPHEIMIVKLAEGKSMDDVTTFMRAPEGNPPFEWLGGMQALSTGQSGWLELDLAAGNYVAFCQVPDFASGTLHHQLGMLTAFTVK